MPFPVPAFAAAFTLALVHIFTGRLRFLDTTPRSVWLSVAGGVSVAYVFVHVLPELSRSQEDFRKAGWLVEIERHVYLLALLGLAVFYGLERTVRASQRKGNVGRGVFILHIGAFAIYNLLFGYLLTHRGTPGGAQLLFYTGAIGLHFLVNDYGLLKDHRAEWHRVARWVLAGAILSGWVLGLSTEITEAGVAALFALLAGGIVLNVLKEELPEERESRFWAFALGVAGYTALLLAAG